MKKIKTISIDFWDTIFNYPLIDKKILRKRISFAYRVLKKHKIKYVHVKKTFLSIYDYFQERWTNEHYTPTIDEMMIFFFDKLKITVSKKDKERLITYNQTLILRFRKFKIIDNAKNIITKLSKKYTLAIISDTGFENGKILRSILEKHNLAKFFTTMLFSDETKISKPNEALFNTVLEKTSSKNFEMIHIGDNEKTDIIGAYNLGIKSILFNTKNKPLTVNSRANYIASNWKEIGNLLCKD